MRTITLTTEQAARYDSDSDAVTSVLMAELRREHGRIAAGEPAEIEVLHPDGFMVSAHTQQEEWGIHDDIRRGGG